MAQTQEYTYDVFVSHSSYDTDYAEDLTEKLEKDNFKCFLFERDILQNLLKDIVRNIHLSRRVVLLITPKFLESKWGIFETMEAIHKCHREKIVAVIPVLHNVEPKDCPHYLRPYRYHDSKDPNFYENIKKAITEDRSTATVIPAGDVAQGLCWSYYYGFLKLVLPGLSDRCTKWSETQTKMPMLKKMIIIIPSTCYCPPNLVEFDPDHFEHAGFIEYTATRAGNIKRDYKSSVFIVKDPKTGQKFRFISEFATPLLSMYEMEQGQISGLTSDEMYHQRMLFTEKLRDILWHTSNEECHNKATILEYDNETTENGQKLGAVLIAHIQNELKTEEELEVISRQMESMSTDTADMGHD